MENVNHQLAYQFWQTHFPELVDGNLTEQHALESNFWDNLQRAYDATDSTVLWAILLSNLPMRLEVKGMYSRIKKTAKHTWHEKQE